MSTSAKKKQTKKAKCKMASPICPDRAEAFVGALADVCPRLSELPSERDAKTFLLASQGMTQREIARVLKISQPTVQRTLVKYRDWFGTTLPEDRGELIGFPRFRVAVEERRILLRHQLEMAMEEWHDSRQPMPMKRKRTKIYPEGRKAGGKKVEEIQIDEYVQRRNPSASHLNAAAKRSLELTMLEAGYLGVRQLSCDDAMDVDERDRWDRLVKNHQKTNEELTRKVAELEAKLAAENSTPHAPREDVFTRSVKSTLDESTAESTPVVNQNPPAAEVASPVQPAPSGDVPDPSQSVSQSMNQELGEGRRASPAMLGEGLRTPPLGPTAGLPVGNVGAGAGDLRSGVSAGSETRAEPLTRAEPVSCQPPKSKCMSDDEIALIRLQIRRLNARAAEH